MSKLLWLLPFTPDEKEIFVEPMAIALGNSCSGHIEVESLDLGLYCGALDLAAESGEIESSMASAIRFSAEWGGFNIELENIRNSVDARIHIEHSRAAA